MGNPNIAKKISGPSKVLPPVRGSIHTLVRQFLKEKIPDDSIDKVVPKEEPDANTQDRRTETAAESEVGIEFLDGKSTGTARFIIDREVTGDVLKKYENQKIARGIIDTL